MEDILDEPSRQSRPQTNQSSQIPIRKQVSKNDFFIDLFENLDLGSEMYISEISKSKISYQKSPKNDHFIDTGSRVTYYGTPCAMTTQKVDM